MAANSKVGKNSWRTQYRFRTLLMFFALKVRKQS